MADCRGRDRRGDLAVCRPGPAVGDSTRCRRPSPAAVGTGLLLGAANFGTVYFLSGALERLAGFRVYTINSVGVIIVAAVIGLILWRERPRIHNYVFLTASIASILLLSG